MRRDIIPESAENTNTDMSSSGNKIIDNVIADLKISVIINLLLILTLQKTLFWN
jgi:hypothetical protein